MNGSVDYTRVAYRDKTDKEKHAQPKLACSSI